MLLNLNCFCFLMVSLRLCPLVFTRLTHPLNPRTYLWIGWTKRLQYCLIFEKIGIRWTSNLVSPHPLPHQPDLHSSQDLIQTVQTDVQSISPTHFSLNTLIDCSFSKREADVYILVRLERIRASFEVILKNRVHSVPRMPTQPSLCLKPLVLVRVNRWVGEKIGQIVGLIQKSMQPINARLKLSNNCLRLRKQILLRLLS